MRPVGPRECPGQDRIGVRVLCCTLGLGEPLAPLEGLFDGESCSHRFELFAVQDTVV